MISRKNPSSRPHVLVVEDEFFSRLHAVNLVEAAGYKAIEASNADEAIAILSEARALPPKPSVLDHINMLEGELHYGLGRFDRATDRFEEVARSASPLSMANLASSR